MRGAYVVIDLRFKLKSNLTLVLSSNQTRTILEQELQELQNSAFFFAEMGLGQAEQHLS